MAEEVVAPPAAARSYIRRGAVGLFIGAVVGALVGALFVVFSLGWGDYLRSLNDNRPAGIVSGNGTEGGFTLLVTAWLALIGAAVGAVPGLIVGVWRARRKQQATAGGQR
ncbi:MAG TPA: hypothetical protein VF297_24390 [Pyrinomonadaceae bacterium]